MKNRTQHPKVFNLTSENPWPQGFQKLLSISAVQVPFAGLESRCPYSIVVLQRPTQNRLIRWYLIHAINIHVQAILKIIRTLAQSIFRLQFWFPIRSERIWEGWSFDVFADDLGLTDSVAISRGMFDFSLRGPICSGYSWLCAQCKTGSTGRQWMVLENAFRSMKDELRMFQ